MKIQFNTEVSDALRDKRPIVALESTVIAHGLPYPHNLETAKQMESVVRKNGAVPATIAVLDGKFCVGLDAGQIEMLATAPDIRKISRRDLSIAIARGLNCATTVATTACIAHRAGIRVFATGGIGGVHRGDRQDVSADLPELAQTPITLVCSGAKIVLDLPATREWLETNGIAVLGWQCDEMPAFYSRSSGLPVDQKVDTPQEVAAIASARDELGLTNSILVTVPVPNEFEIDRSELESILAEAIGSAEHRGITGKKVTPFLLAEMSSRTNGRTMTANIALLKNNAQVAAAIAGAMNVSTGQYMEIRIDDLNGPEIRKMLQEHLAGMSSLSPPESVHALDLDGLRKPEITFWTLWDGVDLLGCGALRALDPRHAEIKSMRTSSAHLRKGVAKTMLTHILTEAERRGYTRLSLETGSMEEFRPARSLYAGFGFEFCGPFADYVDDPNSVFMTRSIGKD